MSNPRRRLTKGVLLTLTTVGACLYSPVLPAQAASLAATVHTEGGELNIRSAPNAGSTRIGGLPNGSSVTVACSVTGQHIEGAAGSTSQWDKLNTGNYVSHAYLTFGNGAGGSVPTCDASGSSGSSSANGSGSGGSSGSGTYQGRVATGMGPLRMRSGPSTSSEHVGSLDDGTGLAISCQVNGQSITGPRGSSAQWDKLQNGRFVSHAYVVSGAVPGCTTQPTGSNGNSSKGNGSTIGNGSKPSTGSNSGSDGGSGGATVSTGDGPVRVRSGPSTSSSIIRQAANGSALTVVCSVTGQYISGTVRATAQWDRLADGNYVSHAYVSGGSIPACTVPVVNPGGNGNGNAGGGSNGAGEPNGSMSNEQFIAAAATGARRTFQEYHVPASVVLAQAINESGWGRSTLAANDHNYFGIKCSDGYRGTIAIGCHTYNTVEYEPYYRETSASFRVYASATDSFRDHGVFLTVNSRYQPAFAYTGDPDKFLYEVWKAGYATSPTYVETLVSVMRRYNLYQYDRS